MKYNFLLIFTLLIALLGFFLLALSVFDKKRRNKAYKKFFLEGLKEVRIPKFELDQREAAINWFIEMEQEMRSSYGTWPGPIIEDPKEFAKEVMRDLAELNRLPFDLVARKQEEPEGDLKIA